MPTPEKNEPEDYFIDRCVPIVKKEHPELSQKAVLGRCYGIWKNHKEKQK